MAPILYAIIVPPKLSRQSKKGERPPFAHPLFPGHSEEGRAVLHRFRRPLFFPFCRFSPAAVLQPLAIAFCLVEYKGPSRPLCGRVLPLFFPFCRFSAAAALQPLAIAFCSVEYKGPSRPLCGRVLPLFFPFCRFSAAAALQPLAIARKMEYNKPYSCPIGARNSLK